MKFKGFGWDELSIFLLICFFLYFFWHSLNVLGYPLSLDEPEGYMLDSTVRFFGGGFLYPDVQVFGTYPYPYTPLFNVLIAPFMLFFGKDYLAGRLLSFVASILCGLVLFKIVRFLNGSSVNALILSLLFYTSRFVFLWSPLFRVDMLALFFSLCGVYFVVTCRGRGWLPILFFVLAFYTKQSFIAAPLAVFTYFFFVDRGFGLKFVSAYVFFVSVFFVIVNQLTSGQFFLQVFSYNIHRFDWSIGLLWVAFFLLLHLPLVLSSFFGFLRYKPSVFSFYLLFSFLLSFSAGKYGAYFNYFIEPFAAMIVLSSLVFNRSGVCRFMLVLSCLLFFLFSINLDYVEDMSGSRIKEFEGIVGFVGRTHGAVLSEDPQIAFFAGKEVLFHPQIFSELEYAGLWNSTGLVGACEDRNFSAVVVYDKGSKFGLFPGLVNCLNSTYKRAAEFDVSGVKYVVYQ